MGSPLTDTKGKGRQNAQQMVELGEKLGIAQGYRIVYPVGSPGHDVCIGAFSGGPSGGLPVNRDTPLGSMFRRQWGSIRMNKNGDQSYLRPSQDGITASGNGFAQPPIAQWEHLRAQLSTSHSQIVSSFPLPSVAFPNGSGCCLSNLHIRT